MAKSTKKSSLFEGIPVVKTTDNSKGSSVKNTDEGDAQEIETGTGSPEQKKSDQKTDISVKEKQYINKRPLADSKFQFKKTARERKTVHKGFLITESMNEKWLALAKRFNMKENQLFESVLEQLFEDQGI